MSKKQDVTELHDKDFDKAVAKEVDKLDRNIDIWFHLQQAYTDGAKFGFEFSNKKINDLLIAVKDSLNIIRGLKERERVLLDALKDIMPPMDIVNAMDELDDSVNYHPKVIKKLNEALEKWKELGGKL